MVPTWSDTLYPPPLTKMTDGTVKQTNPFSGTQVWTVPGRAHRPLNVASPAVKPLDPAEVDHFCAFCPGRLMDTPPEKSRITVGSAIRTGLNASQLAEDPWNFRRVPNLFEILSYDYWAKNYGYQLSHSDRDRMQRYLSDPAGRQHVDDIVTTKLQASGIESTATAREEATLSFFGGGHELIIGRHHFQPGATRSDQLASAGTLTPDEHAAFFELSADAMRSIYAHNRYVRYVQVFQNWLKPAGASFDHLHKQLVGIDQPPVWAAREETLLRQNPNLYNEAAVDYAGYHNLVLAENEHAVMLAGVGHRYPCLEVWSRSEHAQPFDHTADELRGVSDLVQAMHAATGPLVPANEEWYAQPIGSVVNMPWRVLMKWRVSTLAGFEGGTKIYVNTIDPWTLRDRVLPELSRLRDEGLIAETVAIGEECSYRLNSLRYLD
ncbi:DUF4921 family protein [Auritidibacter ignavus]|uniref:DUF4921 family protein n=1 Tax=Auritidibacter ignavus TaxID=678932 RepID=UPI0015D5B4C3|nr:DUF4921 family protein [Auritidibacter ignavus]